MWRMRAAWPPRLASAALPVRYRAVAAGAGHQHFRLKGVFGGFAFIDLYAQPRLLRRGAHARFQRDGLHHHVIARPRAPLPGNR